KLKAFQDAQAQLTGALGRLLAVSENYPDLKSNANFLALQSQLEGTENRIAVARRDYIDAVRAYNTALRTFPTVIWAKTAFSGKRRFGEAAHGEVLKFQKSTTVRRASILAAAVALSFAALVAFALDYPTLTGRVVDQANVISAQSRGALETKLKELEDKSSIQLVAATVKSLQGGDIETYANGLFRFWKLGQAQKNNGVLLLVAPAEHKVRIEVGYGLEGTLTDALSSVIIASAIVPRFKAGDFSGGIERGVDGIINVLSGDSADWQTKVDVRREDASADFDKLFPILFFSLVIFVCWYLIHHAGGGPTGRGTGRRRGGPIFIPY